MSFPGGSTSSFVTGSAVDFMSNSANWQGNDTSVRSVFWPHIHDLPAGSMTPQECAQAIDAFPQCSLGGRALTSIR